MAKTTADHLLAEAARLGVAHRRVSFLLVDLLAEGHEMMRARTDVAELRARQYEITDEHFDRIAALLALLSPSGIRSEAPVGSERKTREAKAARVRLASIRRTLARIGKAAGLNSKVFAVDTRTYARFHFSMAKVVGGIERRMKTLPDRAVVEALVTEAKALLKAESSLRFEGVAIRARQLSNVRLVSQLRRLLYDSLRYVSGIGLAAFRRSDLRALPYRLDRLQPKKRRRSAVSTSSARTELGAAPNLTQASLPPATSGAS